MRLGVMALVAGVLASSPAAAADGVKRTQPPVYHDVQTPPLSQWLAPDAPQRAAIEAGLTQQLVQAAQANRGRVIALRCTGLKLRYEQLSASDQQYVVQLTGNESLAERAYETGVSALLADVMTSVHQQAPSARVTLVGIPLEPGQVGADAVLTNVNYTPLIASIKAIVPTGSLVISGRRDPGALLRKHMPESYRYANGRTILVQANGAWYECTGKADMPATVDTVSDPTNQAPQQLQESAVESTDAYDPLEELQAAWGSTDSVWDLDGNGVVGIHDMFEVLQNWDDYADPNWHGGNEEPVEEPVEEPGEEPTEEPTEEDPPVTEPSGAFSTNPTEYQQGSGQALEFTIEGGTPSEFNVVFQTWSHTAQAIEGAYPDYSPPFHYPGAALDDVSAGTGEVQALIRNNENQVIATVVMQLDFMPPAQQGGDEGGIGGIEDPDPTEDPTTGGDPGTDPGTDPTQGGEEPGGETGGSDPTPDEDPWTGGDGSWMSQPRDWDPSELPFSINEATSPYVNQVVEVFNDQQLEDVLVNGSNKHIIVKYGPVNPPHSWLFKFWSGNVDCILEFEDPNTQVNGRLDIKDDARRFEVRGGKFATVKCFGRPQDMTFRNVRFITTGHDINSIELRGERVHFDNCWFDSDEYAVWSDQGLIDCLFDQCVFMDSVEESPVRCYTLTRTAWLNCIFCNRTIHSTGGIKAAARIMDSTDCGYFGSAFIGSDLWVNMPPGPGRSGDNTNIYVYDCRFSHVSATGWPIRAFGTYHLEVAHCDAESSVRQEMISAASDVTNLIEQNNQFQHVGQVNWPDWVMAETE
jgi:hypothetical protein